MRRSFLATSKVMAGMMFSGGLSVSRARALYKMGKSYCLVNLFRRTKIQYIEIMSTFRCNARCTHCSNAMYTWKDKSLLLSREKIADIIRQSRDLDVPVIIFLGGEPLLDENLPEYVRLTHRCGILPTVASNGQLLGDDSLRQLKRNGVFMIGVTIYSTDPAENEAVTGMPGYLETALENLKKGCEHGIRMQLKCVVTQRHFESGEIQRIVDLAKRLGVFLSINPIVPTGAAHEIHGEDVLDELSQKKLDKLCCESPFVTTHWTSNYFGYGCPAGRAYMGISPYGDVLACYFLPISFGNVWTSSLSDIHQRIAKTSLFTRAYPGCFAAYDRQVIDQAIAPCFQDPTLRTSLPVDLEDHPLYDPRRDALVFDSDGPDVRGGNLDLPVTADRSRGDETVGVAN